jgi:pyrroloquinoline quinone biosynthesis protein D
MTPSIDSVFRLAPGNRLKWDERRHVWVLLAPERMLELDDIAYAIVARLAGQSVGALAQDLAAAYSAPLYDVRRDVLAFLLGLNEKGYLRHEQAA